MMTPALAPFSFKRFAKPVWAVLFVSLLTPAKTEVATAISPGDKIAAAVLAGAKAQAKKATPYIMEYEVLDYPNGDVRAGTGVCTDLVVRAFRNAGIDLQLEISKDRSARPAAYPKLWDKHKPDRNIDHRRCPNLVVWLKKNAIALSSQTDPETLAKDWRGGDIVFYVREGASHPWHVGIVSDLRDSEGMPFIIDSFPPRTSESHRLIDFGPVHSHFRLPDTRQ